MASNESIDVNPHLIVHLKCDGDKILVSDPEPYEEFTEPELSPEMEAAFKLMEDNIPAGPSLEIISLIDSFQARAGWKEGPLSKPLFRGWYGRVDGISRDGIMYGLPQNFSKIDYYAFLRIGVKAKEGRKILVVTLPDLTAQTCNLGQSIKIGGCVGIGTHTSQEIDDLIQKGYDLLLEEAKKYEE